MKSWGRGAEASKQETKNEKRGAALMRSSENPPQLNKIPKIKKENAVVCGDCICNLIRNLVDGVAVRSVLFADADAGADVRQHSIAQHSAAQHFGLGTMLQFPGRRSQDELQLNSIVYEVER